MYILPSSDLEGRSPSPTSLPQVIDESSTKTSTTLAAATGLVFDTSTTPQTPPIMPPSPPSEEAGDPLTLSPTTTPSSSSSSSTSAESKSGSSLPPEIWAPLSCVLILALVAAILHSSRWKAKRIKAQRRYDELRREALRDVGERRGREKGGWDEGVEAGGARMPKVLERRWSGGGGGRAVVRQSPEPPAYAEVPVKEKRGMIWRSSGATRESAPGGGSWWGRRNQYF